MNKADKFKLNKTQLWRVANDFKGQMSLGMQGKASCFKMLPSYLPRACGHEIGRYIALDFGGTNVRALLVELLGAGQVRIVKNTSAKIPAQLTDEQSNATELFAFIASVVAQIVDSGEQYHLAHTFSFPVKQTDVNNGVLVEWAKEFATCGVVGCDINDLLSRALNSKGLECIKPLVLLNDTVATLLAASYTEPDTVIGSICGTGHNTAFFDLQSNMIINLESGNFNLLPCNEYDLHLDSASNNPGRQRLEKMTAGRYLGEIFRLATMRADFDKQLSLDTQLLANIITGSDDRFDAQECELATAIVQRAANLVGACYAGIIMHLDMQEGQPLGIAIDGSLYEKMPLYAQGIQATLVELLGDRANSISIFGEGRGSSVGAAVAAALVHGS